MIVFDLQCGDAGHVFEAWFRSSGDFEEQSTGGLVQCPLCGCSDVAKAPMAPRVPRRGDPGSTLLERLGRLQAEMLRNSEWVGDRFAEQARAMHLGEIEQRPVHGEATAEQAASLVQDGVPVAPLPLPVVPPAQVN